MVYSFVSVTFLFSVPPSYLLFHLNSLFYIFLANKWGCDTAIPHPPGDGLASSLFFCLPFLLSPFPFFSPFLFLSFFSLFFFFSPDPGGCSPQRPPSPLDTCLGVPCLYYITLPVHPILYAYLNLCNTSFCFVI